VLYLAYLQVEEPCEIHIFCTKLNNETDSNRPKPMSDGAGVAVVVVLGIFGTMGGVGYWYKYKRDGGTYNQIAPGKRAPLL
jgi:hypothetical protein